MYFSLGLSLVTVCLRLVEMHEMPLVWTRFMALFSRIGGVHVLVWVMLLFDAFMVLLMWLVARKHKSWARWILLVIFALAIPRYFSGFSGFHPFEANAKIAHEPVVWWERNAGLGLLDRILIFGQFLSQAIALFLIFTSNAHAWFEQSNQSRN